MEGASPQKIEEKLKEVGELEEIQNS